MCRKRRLIITRADRYRDRKEREKAVLCPVGNVPLVEKHRRGWLSRPLFFSRLTSMINQTTRSPWPTRKTVWSHLVNMNVPLLLFARENKHQMPEILWKWQDCCSNQGSNDRGPDRFPLYRSIPRCRSHGRERVERRIERIRGGRLKVGGMEAVTAGSIEIQPWDGPF